MKIIESQIRAQIQASLARGIRLFYVSTFEDSCTSEQALEVLMSLAAKGELEARADVYCPDGELCWGGTLEQLKTLKPFHCSECEQEIEDPKESSQTYFAVPAHIKSQDALSIAKSEITRLRAALELSVDQEREACASIVETATVSLGLGGVMSTRAAVVIAAKIRARGPTMRSEDLVAKAEIARLRYALEQIALPPGTHTMKSVRKIASEALGAK